jgi:hypothetical protein
VLRWGIMGTFAELPFYALMATQLLHGCTFAAVHLGTVGFLGMATPPTLRSSAQAIYTALSDGGFMCMATMMAAKLYSAYNNQVLLHIHTLEHARWCALIFDVSRTHPRPPSAAPRLVGLSQTTVCGHSCSGYQSLATSLDRLLRRQHT